MVNFSIDRYRASRVPAPHHVRAPRRYATHPFVHAHCVLVRMPKGVLAETCCENRMRHWFQACFQWAVTTPRRDWRSSNPAFTIGRGSCRASYPPCLRITPAFPTCCIPVSVSTSGRLGDPLTSFRVNSACGGDGVACDTAHRFGQVDFVANPLRAALFAVACIRVVGRADEQGAGWQILCSPPTHRHIDLSRVKLRYPNLAEGFDCRKCT